MKKVKVVKKLKAKGFPTANKHYEYAHEKASKAEKNKFGKKQYDKTIKLEHTINKNELLGKNDEKGNIKIEKKVPKKLRGEIAYHEKKENQTLKRLNNKGKK